MLKRKNSPSSENLKQRSNVNHEIFSFFLKIIGRWWRQQNPQKSKIFWQHSDWKAPELFP